MAKLSEQQEKALRFLRDRGSASRTDFCGHGIRMPTVYSLVRRKLVDWEYETVGERWKRAMYRLAQQPPAESV